MKKFIVDTGKKKYSVEANDAEHAVELVKTIDVKDRDAIVHRLKTPKDGYSWTVEYESRPYMYDLEFFKNKDEALSWAKRKRLNVIRVIEDSTFITRDEASQLQTVNALIEDEKAAVAAYNVAIENLRGKIPDDSLQVLITTRDDENRHIENLQAVVNGTVTEKNLEDKDSMMNDMGMWVPSKKRNYNEYNMSLSPDKLEIKLKAGMSGNVDRTIIEGAIREAIGDLKEVMSNKSLDQSGVNNVKQVYRELAKQYQGKLYSTNANEALDDLLRLVR